MKNLWKSLKTWLFELYWGKGAFKILLRNGMLKRGDRAEDSSGNDIIILRGGELQKGDGRRFYSSYYEYVVAPFDKK